jgi:histidinol-phosphatase
MNNEGRLLLEAAQELARRTGLVAKRHFKTKLVVESKRDGSPVTAADRAAETEAREWVMSRFPNDGILGEEFEAHRPEAPRRWIIDPIDGTKTFIRGVPLWGSLVAVCEGEKMLAGAASFPALDELIAAAPGLGCWWNGSRAQVSGVNEIGSATVLTTDERFLKHKERVAVWQQLSSQAAISRSWGDCYGYLLVATGRAEVMLDGAMSPWDAAALQPIITEAGGVFTDWEGKSTAFGGNAVATNFALSRSVRELLGVPVTATR